jgi:hypothetical protein
MQQRGVTPRKVESAIRHGKRSPGITKDTLRIDDGEVIVIINKRGDVVTVYARSRKNR